MSTNKVHKNGLLNLWADPLQPTNYHARTPYRYKASPTVRLVPLAIGVAGIALALVGWFVDAQQFYFSYLTAWAYCVSISLGALFFVMIQHLTRAKWSIVVRRIPEALIWSFPILALLSLPILFGMHDLYHWTHEELYDPASPQYDPILAGKQAYLNVPFFIGRLVFYFAVWSYLAYRLYTLSVEMDVNPDAKIPAKLRFTSAWGLALTAITTAFAGFDILMSTYPHWFSTMFGVYFFAGAFWSAHAMIAFSALLLQRNGMLTKAFTKEHLQDLGKFMFGFTVFWTYIAFSQYMLIWYGNLPEETVWFKYRMSHGWEYASAALLIAHFILPFFLLLPRSVKRVGPYMAVMAVWCLVMQWFDIWWVVAPVLHKDHAMFSWIDFACWLGLFGLYVWLFLTRLSRHSIVPQNDPHLKQSLHFVNS